MLHFECPSIPPLLFSEGKKIKIYQFIESKNLRSTYFMTCDLPRYALEPMAMTNDDDDDNDDEGSVQFLVRFSFGGRRGAGREGR